MSIIKNIIGIIFLLFLNNCMQSTAMIGPSMTLVSTGNIYNAGLSYGANKAVEKETGMQTSEYIINKIEDYPTNNNLKEDQLNSLMILLELNIEKTKKKIN